VKKDPLGREPAVHGSELLIGLAKEHLFARPLGAEGKAHIPFIHFFFNINTFISFFFM